MAIGCKTRLQCRVREGSARRHAQRVPRHAGAFRHSTDLLALRPSKTMHDLSHVRHFPPSSGGTALPMHKFIQQTQSVASAGKHSPRIPVPEYRLRERPPPTCLSEVLSVGIARAKNGDITPAGEKFCKSCDRFRRARETASRPKCAQIPRKDKSISNRSMVFSISKGDIQCARGHHAVPIHRHKIELGRRFL